MNNRPLLEVCVGSVDDALSAVAAGADRLELCSALELGGLTPSVGLAEQVLAAVAVPVVVMLRPRAGGFAYSESEFSCMETDGVRLLALGASGIVFGTLTESGNLDEGRIGRLVEIAGDYETVFHKAFDAIDNRLNAMERLIQLGVTRVLTSGGAAAAQQGAKMLNQLVAAASDRIEVLPGGGISGANARDLVARTGCRSLHAGVSTARLDLSISSRESAAYCDFERLEAGAYRGLDAERLKELIVHLNNGA